MGAAMRLDVGQDLVVALGPFRGKRLRAMPGVDLERCLDWTNRERGLKAQGQLPGIPAGPGVEALRAQAEALVAERRRRWWGRFGAPGGGR